MLAAIRDHDLPVSWDGDPVTWRPWVDVRSSLAYHAPAHELACERCGLIDERLVTCGSRPPVEGATVPATVTRRTRRTGRAYTVTRDVPAHRYLDLWAFRCRGCGHDVVHDSRTGESWDLNPDDYGPLGSIDTKEAP